MKDSHITQRDIDKIIAGIIYIVKGLGKGAPVDHHSVFKTMYLSDKKKLAESGVAIFNDWYQKMEYGPVPSISRDALFYKERREKRKQRITYMGKELDHVFDTEYIDDTKGKIPMVIPKIDADKRHFSQMELEFLDESICEILSIGITPDKFADRSHVTHDQAYNGAQMGREITERAIVEAFGKDGVLSYFNERQGFASMFR